MTGRHLRAGRRAKGWSQTEAARRLGVSQPYLAMLERGQRPVTRGVLERAVKAYGLAATAVPPASAASDRRRVDAAALARDVAGLGYAPLAYLGSRRWKPKNPAEVLLAALAQDDLEARLVEALPWLVRCYWRLDWTWLVREAKVRDLQNRLGFVVSLARRLAERAGEPGKALVLRRVERDLEPSRLLREDTLCEASLPEAERRWFRKHRSADARHWNLLTDWTPEAVRYAG